MAPAKDCGRDPARPTRLELEREATPPNVPEFRNAVGEFAERCGAESPLEHDVRLSVTEAVTNAVLHAFVGRAPGTVRVVAEAAEAAIVVRVIDDGRGMQPHPDSPGLGMGLPMIARLTERFDVRAGPDERGTELRMVFHAPGVAGPPVERGAARVQLLADVTRVSEGSGWPAEGVDQLVELVVPQFADACAVDVMDESGMLRRAAAAIETDDPAVREWLVNRTPRPYDGDDATARALQHRSPAVLVIDAAGTARISADDQEAKLVRASEIRWWVVVPLGEDQPLGTLGFGLREERGRPDEDLLGFLALLGERAARGLANSAVIGELRRTRRRLERILGALGEAVTVHDAGNKILYGNEAAARLLGAASVAELLTAEPGELAARFTITREDGSPVGLADLPGPRLVAGERVEPMLTRSVERATGIERWLLTKSTLLEADDLLIVNIIEDVTETKAAELRQRFLARAGVVLNESLDYGETLRHVADLVVPDIADWCAVDILDDGGLERLALAHVHPEKRALGQEIHRRYPPDLAADTGLGGVLRTGEAKLFPEITDEMLAAGIDDGEHLELLRQIGLRSVMLVPMRARGRTVGALTFVNAESGRVFGDDDLEFAEAIAARAALAVENARLYRAARHGDG